jgi:hypothetical protein
MMRIALIRSARSLLQQPLWQRCAIARPASLNTASYISRPSQFAPPLSSAVRFYSAPAGLTQEQVEGRILDLLKNFDKVFICYYLWLRKLTFDEEYVGQRSDKGIFMGTITSQLYRLLRYYSSHPIRTSPTTLAWIA